MRVFKLAFIHEGSTAASESADVVILLDDISRTVRAVRIGKDTVRVAVQRIWLGIILSVTLMVIAAFGLSPATAGAISQEIVDLVTIVNALRAIGGQRDEAAARRVPVGAASAAAETREETHRPGHPSADRPARPPRPGSL